MKVREAVVQRLREILDDRNITLYQLQKNSGVPQGTFLTIFYGDRKGINLTTLLILIQSLNITPKEFFDSKLFNEGNLDID